MADYEGNGLAAFNDARSRGWSGSVTLADLEKLSAGNPIMHGIAAVWPDAPPSRADQAYQTSIDRWKQLGKDVFFAPANGLKAFNEQPTFNNALGIMPMGTFGGPLAKTANRAALSKAQTMTISGVPREQIWKETGWFHAPDGNWKFEIPDNAATYAPGKIEQGFRDQGYTTEQIRNMGTATEMSRVLEHPEIYKAYPEAANWPWGAIPPEKMYNKSAGGEWLGRNRGMSINNEVSPSLPRGKSVTMHETQHGIQEIEGWPIGTNPAHEQTKWFGEVVRPIEMEMAKFQQHPQTWDAFVALNAKRANNNREFGKDWVNNWPPEKLDEFIAAEEALHALPGGRKLSDLDWRRRSELGESPDKSAERWGYGQYMAHPGEIEARVVQRRMNLTPEQRSARPPWLDYDVEAAGWGKPRPEQGWTKVEGQ